MYLSKIKYNNLPSILFLLKLFHSELNRDFVSDINVLVSILFVKNGNALCQPNSNSYPIKIKFIFL